MEAVFSSETSEESSTTRRSNRKRRTSRDPSNWYTPSKIGYCSQTSSSRFSPFVCVCVREREREREFHTRTKKNKKSFAGFSLRVLVQETTRKSVLKWNTCSSHSSVTADVTNCRLRVTDVLQDRNTQIFSLQQSQRNLLTESVF